MLIEVVPVVLQVVLTTFRQLRHCLGTNGSHAPAAKRRGSHGATRRAHNTAAAKAEAEAEAAEVMVVRAARVVPFSTA